MMNSPENRYDVYATLTPYQQKLFEEWVKKAEFVKAGLKTTICLLTLMNGFEVVGTSACVNPADFDATIGKEYALKEALRKLDGRVGFYRQVILAGEGKIDEPSEVEVIEVSDSVSE